MATKRKMKRKVNYYHTRLSHDKIKFIHNLGTKDVNVINQKFTKRFGAPLRESTIVKALSKKVYDVKREETPKTINKPEVYIKFDGMEYKLRHFANKFIIDLVLKELNNHNE